MEQTQNQLFNLLKRIKPAHNSVYVAIAGEVVNRRYVHLINFCGGGQESASNPLLHIHANRYKPFYKTEIETLN
jgi:hypothetical protein